MKVNNNFREAIESDMTFPLLDRKLFLPTSKEEMERLGWDYADIIIFLEMRMWIIHLSVLL